jgi:hypothetical protein
MVHNKAALQLLSRGGALLLDKVKRKFTEIRNRGKKLV